ncbi:Acyl-CoA dehydrogenase [Marinobacter sp. es.048]|uniref:acyl-CoA dehydrogenase family protein n=1 Tax=Marinobacter sp. es.048 TaxID=1761795 RepID=UPI000B596C24|nr:acyl-CoA dehydrogenase family protein [Marinobacter sp. es.048]SNC62623.1 Acyl-CoA dehydrogenase [Marinobacter sp. es.048]
MAVALDSESKSIINATLQRFVADSYDFSARSQRLAEPLNYLQFWPVLADLGVLSLPLDEAQGGLGGHASDIADAAMTLAPGLILEPFTDAAVIGGSVLGSVGTSVQPHINRLINGEAFGVLLGGRGGDPGQLKVSRDGDGYRLDGELKVQPYASEADFWLIAAHDVEGCSQVVLFATPDEIDVPLHSYRLMDDRPACDLWFERVLLTDEALLLKGSEANQALKRARALAVCSLAAEAVGILASLVTATGEYLNERQQFGVPLSNFQALQHRLADMHIGYLEARALVDKLALAVEQSEDDEVRWLSYAVTSIIERSSRSIGHESIQMHGGMGVTDELVVSHFHKRLVVLVHQMRGWVEHDVEATEWRHEASLDAGGSVESDFDETAFRREVREFVATHLKPETRAKVQNGLYLEKSDYVDWQKALREKGWFGAAWPVEAGGKGWSILQEHVFLQECALGAAPMIIPYGVNMLGPVLYTFGNEEQKRRYLPGILNSDTWWCQGYSEPNAGSDLAALKTRAVRDGDFWVVNGTKMWTTEAQWADMMHCLVRTESTGKKQAGISFLLIDMNTPGITIEPIITLDGVHHTNQVFLDNVRVPVENLVGEEGAGWTMAKYLLSRERGFIADTGNKLRMMAQIRMSVSQRSKDFIGNRELQKARLLELEASLAALIELERSYINDWMRGRDDGIGASVLKVRSTELLQRMAEFWSDSLGPYGQCYDPALRLDGEGLSDSDPTVQAASVNYSYLYSRCWSIFGGTNEVQRNIIAARLLRN